MLIKQLHGSQFRIEVEPDLEICLRHHFATIGDAYSVSPLPRL